MKNNWYDITDIDSLDSPALVVFPKRVKANIQTAIGMVNDIALLRPHVKTNKSPDACQLMLDAGIKKFKCATIAEAEMLGIIGAPDVLLAYQPLGPKLHRFVELIKKFPATKFSCLTDNFLGANEQNRAFSLAGLTVPVYIDLNIGMNRTGVLPDETALELGQYCASQKALSFAGLHAYDGHIRSPDFNLRTKECNQAFEAVHQLNESFSKNGIRVATIIAGGSPTFPIHTMRKDVECSPGTFIYWDKGYTDSCPEQNFLPAAVLVTRVISNPSPTRICLDLGHKSVAAENEITRRVFFPDQHEIVPVSQSEEHLVCEVGAMNPFHTGDVFYGLPYHICPTVALYERLQTIEDGKITGEWRTLARDRKISI